MTVLDTAIDSRHPAYLENRSAMLERLAELETALDEARAGGGEKCVTRHHARGKLLPRERVELLLDQDAPFLELSAVAAWGSDFVAGASVVTGIGVVEGIECMIVANDPTIAGGAVNPYTIGKIRRAARIAAVNRLPLINLVESSETDGQQGEPTTETPLTGVLARDLTQLAAARIATVTVVLGATTGEAAYLPALCDYTIMVRGHAKVLSIRPQSSRSGTNGRPAAEVRSGPVVPLDVAGYADHFAEDERDGLRLARQCVRRFNWRKHGPGPRTTTPLAPRHDAEDLLTIAGRRSDGVCGSRELLARVLDGSDFDEFRPTYGPAVLTGWGELHGYPIGVLADTGAPLGAAETQKAVHFIQLANASATPLLLVSTGPSPRADRDERDGPHLAAPLIHALTASRVPLLSLGIGDTDGVGAGHGRAYEARFAFTWPARRSGPGPAAGDLPDDGVIDPRDTRTVLGLCLSAIHSAAVEGAAHAGVVRP